MRHSVFYGLLLVLALIILSPLPAAGFNIAMDYWLGSSPAVGSDDTIYAVSTDGKLKAFDAEGNKKWEFKTESQITTSPAVGDDGQIYFGTMSEFFSLNNDGSRGWVFDTSKPVTASPAVDRRGNAYFSIDEGREFYCINRDGVILWFKVPGSEISPALDETNGLVYVVNPEGYLTAHNTTDGSTKWDVFVGTPKSNLSVGPDGTVSLQTMKEGFTFLVSVTPWGTVRVNLSLSSSQASKPGGSARAAEQAGGTGSSSPVIDVDGTIYIGHGNKFYAFTPKGVNKWDYTAGGEIKSTAAIGADGIIYFGSSDGRINMLNRQGTLVGWFTAGGAIESSPTLTPNGMLYFGAADGKLYGLPTSSPGLAKSAWPMYMHDPGHTGRADRRIALPFLNLLLLGN